MEYLWNKEYLKRYYAGSLRGKRAIEKQIEVLEKVIYYDPELDALFQAHGEEFCVEEDIVEIQHVITISAVLIVKNEERCISRCIESILPEFDEVIIVDTGSTDRTIEIIQSVGMNKIKLYFKEWMDDFSDARNYALEQVTSEWAFFIDADEYLDRMDLSVKEYFSVFEKFPYIKSTIFSPKIIDVNGNVSIGVERIFRIGAGIKYYGKVHEELRKYGDGRVQYPYKVSLDLPIKHDGYIKEVFDAKKKSERNLGLIKSMMEEEPQNPRWVYFFLRDGKEVIPLEDYKQYIKQYVLSDASKPIEIDNLKKHTYTYALLTLYALKEFLGGELSEVKQAAELMNDIRPGNSDSVYLSTYLEIFSIKRREYDLLKKIVGYRKENLESQYGMMHSEGKHIDLLIGYLLFQTGHIRRATEYFQSIEDIADRDILINGCKNVIRQIKVLEE